MWKGNQSESLLGCNTQFHQNYLNFYYDLNEQSLTKMLQQCLLPDIRDFLNILSIEI